MGTQGVSVSSTLASDERMEAYAFYSNRLYKIKLKTDDDVTYTYYDVTYGSTSYF